LEEIVMNYLEENNVLGEVQGALGKVGELRITFLHYRA
jgi:hypothetical protein